MQSSTVLYHPVVDESIHSPRHWRVRSTNSKQHMIGINMDDLQAATRTVAKAETWTSTAHLLCKKLLHSSDPHVQHMPMLQG
jgi:hypothetical protein